MTTQSPAGGPQQQDEAPTGGADTGESARTVAVAVAANLAIALAKGVAAVLTGSSSMAAETAHSVADTGNEVLLYIGLRRGAKPPDDRHPFGYGQARYFWSLLAAVGVFVVGGLFAIAEGVNTLRHPEPVTSVRVGVAVLVVSAVLEGISWRNARRELKAEADERDLGLRGHMASSSNPTPSTVFLEDSAALVGLALACVALVLHAVTGSAVYDGVASLLIGLLLIVVAVLLIRRSAALLIDESTSDRMRDRLRDMVAEEPWVAEVAELVAVRMGPSQLLVVVDVVPTGESGLTADIGRLRRRLLDVTEVVRVEITPVEPRA